MKGLLRLRIRMGRLSVFVASALVLLAVCAHAQIPGVEPERAYSLSGYVKYLSEAGIPQSGSNTWNHLIHQRFNFEYRWTDALTFTAQIRPLILILLPVPAAPPGRHGD